MIDKKEAEYSLGRVEDILKKQELALDRLGLTKSAQDLALARNYLDKILAFVVKNEEIVEVPLTKSEKKKDKNEQASG